MERDKLAHMVKRGTWERARAPAAGGRLANDCYTQIRRGVKKPDMARDGIATTYGPGVSKKATVPILAMA